MVDVRNLGLVAAAELEPVGGTAGRRASGIFVDLLGARRCSIRQTGDIIALSPLVIERSHIDQMFGTLAEAVRNQR